MGLHSWPWELAFPLLGPSGPAVPMEGAQEAVGGGDGLAEALMRGASTLGHSCSSTTATNPGRLGTWPLRVPVSPVSSACGPL